MSKSKKTAPQPIALPPLDTNQRYSVREAIRYLRSSRASLYKLINAKPPKVRVIRQATRTYIPGSEIARLSR